MARMAEQLCPVCGCTITPGEAYEKEGVMYCCEPCATGEGTVRMWLLHCGRRKEEEKKPKAGEVPHSRRTGRIIG